ncbi:MAG: PAS domain S-box protein [Thermodesulfobacteriota bacterium]
MPGQEEIERLHQRIKELERCGEELKEREKLFLDLLNATEEATILIDLEGKILVANQNAARLYGLPLEKVLGTSIYGLIPSSRIKSAQEKVRRVVESRQSLRFEGRFNERVFENSLYPVFNEELEVKGIAIYVRDITEKKQLAKILEQTEEKYRNIFENAMEGIFQVDPEGRLLNANPALAQIHGYDSPEALISSIKDVSTLYQDPQDHQRLVRLLFQQGLVQNYEVQMRRKDDKPQWISINVRLVKDTNGKPVYYEGTMIDITQRKMAEEALIESEERYRIAIEHSNDAVAIIQGDRIQYVNKRFTEIFGYDRPEDLMGQSVLIVVHPEDQEKVRSVNQRRQRGEPVPSQYEFKGLTRDGRTIYIEVSATSIHYRGTPVYLVYLRDTTERKMAEELMRKERDRFRTLSESAPFGIILINTEGRFEYVNPKFKELFGYELHEIPSNREWFRKAFPDPKVRREVISTWISYLESTKPGEKVPRTLPTTCKDGTEKIIHFIPVRLSTREYIVTLEDVTESIRAHEALIRSHQELERLNRAKSKAVNLISHELRTPLSVIQGNIRLLKKKLKPSLNGSLQKTIEVLERNLERLSNISKETDEIFRISQELEAGVLLDNLDRLFERIANLSEMPSPIRSHFDALKEWLSKYLSGRIEEFQSINLFPFVLDVVERVKSLSRHRKINFQVEGKNDLFVFIDPLILQNVVEGLLKNAIENTPDGGTVRIKVEKNQEKIFLHVSDEGVGVTEENQPYLFDGLFSTKETELYASKKPYDFGAGGKGLDLFRMKVYGEKFGFDISMTSRRCIYLPTDQDQCPGDISKCPHIKDAKECAESGGTTFTVAFPSKKSIPSPKD